MKVSNWAAALMTLSCAIAVPMAQAENIKFKLAPGLWEQTTTTLMDGKNLEESMHKQMEQTMSRMTPEQRAQMQKAMDKISGGGKIQTCLTPAAIAKGIDTDNIRKHAANANKDCTVTVTSMSDTGAKFDMVCTRAQGTQKGTGEYKLKSDKEWSFNMVSNGTMTPHGNASAPARTMQITVDMQARWKGSDCGSVAPKE